MSTEFQHVNPIVFEINRPIETDIRERIRSFDFIKANMGLVNQEYLRKKPATIIYKFRKTYYEIKCKNKLRNILWNKIRSPKIAEKYSPQNLMILLESLAEDDNDENLNKILTEWE